jgi:hypothetical protein
MKRKTKSRVDAKKRVDCVEGAAVDMIYNNIATMRIIQAEAVGTSGKTILRNFNTIVFFSLASLLWFQCVCCITMLCRNISHQSKNSSHTMQYYVVPAVRFQVTLSSPSSLRISYARRR